MSTKLLCRSYWILRFVWICFNIHLLLSPDNSWLEELENIEEKREEDDWENVDEQSLFEAGVVKLQCSGYRNPKSKSIKYLLTFVRFSLQCNFKTNKFWVSQSQALFSKLTSPYVLLCQAPLYECIATVYLFLCLYVFQYQCCTAPWL